MPQTSSNNSAASESFTYTRRYEPGEAYQYEVRVRDSMRGSELIGVTEHRVFVRNDVPAELVRWIRLSESELGDLSSMVLEVPAYELSLDPRGELKLLDIKGDPILLEMVTDLYAFFFSVSPEAGIQNLTRVGDSYTRPDLVSGEWADGSEFIAGASRSQLRLSLVSIAKGEVVYQSDSTPPASASLTMLRPWMDEAVCGDAPNNVQFVRRQDDGFLAAAGCEKTQVTSRIDPVTGKILAAFMDNEMVWRMKLCAESGLTYCEDRPNVTRRRFIELRLKPPQQELISSQNIRVNPKDSLEYVWIKPGSFQMGCVPGDEECYAEEKPQHPVKISKGFWMSRSEIPVSAYEKFIAASGRQMPAEPGSGAMPGFNDGWRKKNHPMVKVTWDEAGAFCAWAGGRLPSEAEWEYAARGGVEDFKYSWGNDRSHDEANYWRSGGRDEWFYTAPVASFPPNTAGLYDMCGNVYEWVADWYSADYYESGPEVDPRGPANGKLRVARGGAGFINPAVLRISTRLRNAPDSRNVNLGIRCAIDKIQ